jgi:organic hydroperoxide reductase OsmC/OhrA
LKWSPEDLLLASVNTCQLASFLSLARLKKFEIASYTSEAEGLIEHDGTGYRYTKIILKPRVGVKSEQDIETARGFIEKAHHGCWMGRSVKAEVIVEAEIFVAR